MCRKRQESLCIEGNREVPWWFVDIWVEIEWESLEKWKRGCIMNNMSTL